MPNISSFVDRPVEMTGMRQALLPGQQPQRRHVYILRGLGGIGKTQLAVEFARQFRPEFSAVFWLDGSTESNLKSSFARCARRILTESDGSPNHVPPTSTSINVDDEVKALLDWLKLAPNFRWLLIFDNVDRDYDPGCNDTEAYDITRYFPTADHGSILVTTRLERLEQLGTYQHVGKVSQDQAKAILKTWYRGNIGRSWRNEMWLKASTLMQL